MIGGIEEAMNISTHSLTRRLTTVYRMLSIPLVFQLTASQGG